MIHFRMIHIMIQIKVGGFIGPKWTIPHDRPLSVLPTQTN